MNRDDVEYCSFWGRSYALSSHLVLHLAATGAQYSVKVGAEADGLVLPSFGRYGTCTLEARTPISLFVFSGLTDWDMVGLDPFADHDS